MKKTLFILTLLFIVNINNSNAQRSELGIIAGGTYYIGDINPYYHFANIKPAGGLLYRYNFTNRLTLKANFIYGNIASSDNSIGYYNWRQLSFKTSIYEFSPQLEINFLPYQIGNDKIPVSPYIFGGISVFKFNPKSSDGLNLHSLSTEAQGTSLSSQYQYSLITFAIPFGMGVKRNFGNYISIGAEWGMRKTFTDFLDDISGSYPNKIKLSNEVNPNAGNLSNPNEDNDLNNAYTSLQRGNSKTKDWYSFIGVFITFKIKDSQNTTCPAYK